MSKRLNDNEKDRMRERITKLIGKRIQMAEFPFAESQDVYDFWERNIDPEFKHAIDVLRNSKAGIGMLDRSYYISLRVGDFRVEVSCDEYFYWSSPDGGFIVPDIAPEYEALKLYAETMHRVVKESDDTISEARSLIHEANAAGQIKRVWPELASFLGNEAAGSIRSVQRASRIPGGYNMEEFNEHSDMFNRVLAEAHILPDLVRGNIDTSVREA